MRHAVYFVPPPNDPLGRLATQWLGRDSFTGNTVTMPQVGSLTSADVAYHTAAARRYGFHATLKAPFRLARGVGEQELVGAFQGFCANEDAFVVPRMKITRMGGFFALVPARPSLEIDALACKTVLAFERFRAPLSEAEIARRQPGSLTVAQLRNLHRWGYPHVLDTFRFHMTLTGRVAESDRRAVETALQEWFAPVIDLPMHLASLSLMIEPEPGAPFRVREHARLEPLNQRMTA